MHACVCLFVEQTTAPTTANSISAVFKHSLSRHNGRREGRPSSGHVTESTIVMSTATWTCPLLSFCVQVPPPHDRRMLWKTPSTKCLREELRRMPSHWASSWMYVCVGCESAVHSYVSTGVYTSMCVYCVFMYALYICEQCVHTLCVHAQWVCATVSILNSVCVHLLKYTVNIPMSICTHVCTYVYSLIVSVPLSLHVWVRVHTCTCTHA